MTQFVIRSQNIIYPSLTCCPSLAAFIREIKLGIVPEQHEDHNSRGLWHHILVRSIPHPLAGRASNGHTKELYHYQREAREYCVSVFIIFNKVGINRIWLPTLLVVAKYVIPVCATWRIIDD